MRSGACTAPQGERAADDSLDMGTGFDCFDVKANTDASGLTAEEKRTATLLVDAMARHGFKNYPKEWWHYTLEPEPYPDTIFNFPDLAAAGAAELSRSWLRRRLIPRSSKATVPARLERLPWSRFHTLVVIALGVTWVLDGLEVTLAGAVAGALKTSSPPTLQCRGRTDEQLLSRRRRRRRAPVRLAHRPARTQAAVLDHARHLPRRHRGDRALLGPLQLLAVPLSHWRRHRRRIHGDRLHHPGVHPRALSRLDRSRHQWKLLDRRGA